MPDRVLLRYFDCLGRTQPLRNALVDAGIAFEDQRLAIGPSWRALKEQADGGPFGSLPVLEWGDDCVAQALPIGGYVARRLGQYDELDAAVRGDASRGDRRQLKRCTRGAGVDRTRA